MVFKQLQDYLQGIPYADRYIMLCWNGWPLRVNGGV